MRTWTDDDLRQAVTVNTTIAGVLRQLGLSISPGNYRTVKKYITSLSINTDHFLGQSHGTTVPSNTVPLEHWLQLGSNIGSTKLRKKLLRAKLLRNECYLCKLGPLWNEVLLVLQLDHINGNSDDNRLDNLRLLCPNCHSQTSTFTGKNKARRYS